MQDVNLEKVIFGLAQPNAIYEHAKDAHPHECI